MRVMLRLLFSFQLDQNLADVLLHAFYLKRYFTEVDKKPFEQIDYFTIGRHLV